MKSFNLKAANPIPRRRTNPSISPLMAAVDFKSIEQEIAALAGNVFPKYVGQATQDAKTFVQNTQAKYLEYVAQLADPGPDGIDEDDFEANMLDLQALAEMDLLTQEG